MSSNCRGSQSATGNPRADRIRAQSHSFSMEWLRSSFMFPTSPMGSLRICVVGVAPCGRHHWPSTFNKAVFSCAPAMEIRKSSSSREAAPAKAGGATVPRRMAATSCSSNGVASILPTSPGAVPSGRSCSAPTQSRPICVSSSKASVDRAPKRLAARARMSWLSGRRLSNQARTASPRCGEAPGVNGRESDSGRPCGAAFQFGSYSRTSRPFVPSRQVPTNSPFIHNPKLRRRDALLLAVTTAASPRRDWFQKTGAAFPVAPSPLRGCPAGAATVRR
jgi:hypothetical protein